jgi:hypothetical protein
VVLHAEDDARVLRGGPHIDRVARHRVLRRVRKEIEEELTQAVAVAAHRRQRLDDVGGDRDLVGRHLDHGRGLPDEVGDVDVAEGVREGAGFDTRGVEDVADETREASRLLLDERQERLALLG